MEFKRGDRVKVEYRFREFYEGVVVFVERSLNLDWVTVRPDDQRMIYTFGSSRDMSNGYKSYIANDKVLGRVTKI